MTVYERLRPLKLGDGDKERIRDQEKAYHADVLKDVTRQVRINAGRWFNRVVNKKKQ